MLHSNNFNFNDTLIDKAGEFWLALVKDRLELTSV
jgi:hypothetical protein